MSIALTQEQEHALLDIVRHAARTEIMPRFRQLSANAIQEKTSSQDLVTEADVRAEQVISAGVRELLPEAAVIGEEAVAEHPEILEQIASADMAVIIDPIDGTWNYAKGVAVFGVIVAVTVRGETVFGLLYDPVLDDWILARKGGGSWYGKPGQAAQRLQLPQDERELGQRVAMVSHFLFPESQRAAVAVGALAFARSHCCAVLVMNTGCWRRGCLIFP
ncbi:MAG: inositol monophosphatase family protein [Thiolinea sp.]